MTKKGIELMIQASACLVEAKNNAGEVVAKAFRADVKSPWFFGCVINGKMTNVGELNPWVPEVFGRKMVLAIVTEMAKQ